MREKKYKLDGLFLISHIFSSETGQRWEEYKNNIEYSAFVSNKGKLYFVKRAFNYTLLHKQTKLDL